MAQGIICLNCGCQEALHWGWAIDKEMEANARKVNIGYKYSLADCPEYDPEREMNSEEKQAMDVDCIGGDMSAWE